MTPLSIQPDLAARLIQRAAQKNVSVDRLLEDWLNLDSLPTQSNLLAQPNLLLQQISDAVISTDPQLSITAWNKAAELTYGWTAAEAIGQPLDALLKTVWVSVPQAQAVEALKETGRWRGEILQQTKDGRACNIWASVSWVKSDDGTVIGGITVNRDITEHKHAALTYQQMERDLAASEAQYRLIAENTSDGILIFDPSGTVLYASPAYDRQLGREEGATVNRDSGAIYETVHPEDHKTLFGNIYAAISQKRDTLTYVYRVRHTDGHYIWREDHAKFKYQDDGSLAKTYVISRDVTERMQTQAALQRQNAYLTALHQITLDLLNHHHTTTLLQSIVDYASVILDAPYGEITLIENGELVVKTCTANQPFLVGDHTKRSEACLSWQAYDTGQVVIDDNYSSNPKRRSVYDSLSLSAVACIPIVVNQVCKGVIDLSRTMPNYPFTPEQIQQGVMFAQIVALLLENVQLNDAAAQEIDRRRQVEEALRRSETHLKSLLDSQSAYVIRTDLQGNYTYVNDAFFNKFHWMVASKEAFIGIPCLQTVITEDHPKMIEVATACMQQPGRTVQIILRKPNQNGGVFYTVWDFVALTDVSGVVNEMQCIGIDFTDLMVARNQLQIQQQALESTANAISITNRSGVLQWVNPAFTTLTGYSLTEAVGRTPRILKSGVQDHNFYKTLWDTILAGQTWHGQLVNKRKDGTLYTEEQTITPVYNDMGEISHFVAVKQDVTEREQAQQSQLEQERLKVSLKKEQEFILLIQEAVSILSHDARIPLTVISAAKDTLEHYFDQLDEPKRQAKLISIGRQVHYMIELLDNVALTINGTDRLVFNPKFMNLAVLCQVCVSEVQETIGSKHHLTFITDGQITTAVLDETLMSRILLNMLSNAIKYSAEGTDICLALGRQGDWIVLRVIDQGMGISEADLPHIFEPFFRTQSAKRIRGTGLGLHIVKDCIVNHQGQVAVESEVGKGTTFTIRLPLNLSAAVTH